MTIKMKQALATPRGTYQKSNVYDLPDDVAERFVERGLAEKFDIDAPPPAKGRRRPKKAEKMDTPESEKV
ncbi:MAG: hypothetical protein AAF916_04135 [Planctomycetota bacterium]